MKNIFAISYYFNVSTVGSKIAVFKPLLRSFSTDTKKIDWTKYNDKIVKANSEEVEKINQSIIRFNGLKVNYNKSPQWSEIHYVLKDENNSIIAGIESYLLMDSVLNINVLFVGEKYRGQGYGSMMLKKVEIEAKAKGAYMAKLDTFSFQEGLEFYKKHGYKTYAVLKDSPIKGQVQYYMKKNLDSSNIEYNSKKQIRDSLEEESKNEMIKSVYDNNASQVMCDCITNHYLYDVELS